ncbi:hypothetical protein QWT69_03625 [Sporosarcina oncorhynchi]|uniref:Uncharacterized protein n=1 Tax=Sporosarcina oncorhynchi TaxID=3056444 RepID=A0ABZ0L6M8_9BACL|nr:hypothetical protein [Sporosarcina sp. T2O-4]WOV88225.1 hypothetical protein QWT69_03625 [Sporosarcina sp. T2O-4]
MDAMEKKLRDELLRNPNVKLLETLKWSLPVQTIDISYETVKRTKMDILMKMLLTAFRTGAFSSAAEVSDMLVVEPLFIEDMIEKMTATGMIRQSTDAILLTDSGKRQLESGIYVQPPEKDETTVHYSPVHEDFVTGEVEESVKETYRYMKDSRQLSSYADADWRRALEQLDVLKQDETGQITIQSIASVTELDGVFAPCIEFQLRQVEEDRYFVRVWNTMTNLWDEKLEEQILAKEVSEWRERHTDN